MTNRNTICARCSNEIFGGEGDLPPAWQRLCKPCQENKKKGEIVEEYTTANRCGFCGCRPGDEARWEAAADIAEFAFQERYMRLIVERLKDLAWALEQDMHEARRYGWSTESIQRGRSDGGEA